jgi:hypothetical protein
MSIPLQPEQVLEDNLVAQLIGLEYRRAAVRFPTPSRRL